ncbi:TlpA disulfide reductase family protein [Pedobacter sp. ASV28]|jgi:thiol-disulfide isomerase/thioredoxin|uniref:TlpA disulfide reductase family protein n=1 Tax=Pedobacter sp. ASV28 TaxID=2795123 RepID=UPI0018EC3524|nr:TlpA disulfide reductase family protein [Pedobacter sp. ASV28]
MTNKITIYIVLAMLCQKKPKAKRPKLKAYVLIALLLCLNFGAMAQDQTEIKPFYVGDLLPETFWQQEHHIYANGKINRQTLATYKEKLLVLDFWATWCGSCIKKFSLLDSLQHQYPHELAVLLVNAKKSKDNQALVGQTLEAYSLSSVLADTLLSLNFPHRMLPHYVWLHNGRVFAITDATHVNPYMLTTVLARYREIKSYNKPKKRP